MLRELFAVEFVLLHVVAAFELVFFSPVFFFEFFFPSVILVVVLVLLFFFLLLFLALQLERQDRWFLSGLEQNTISPFRAPFRGVFGTANNASLALKSLRSEQRGLFELFFPSHRIALARLGHFQHGRGALRPRKIDLHEFRVRISILRVQ